MRFFDDPVGCYLDDIGHRVEKTKDGKELKVVDLTLRVQPLTPELAIALDPDVRSLLFSMNDAEPKPKIKAVELKLSVPRQQLTVALLPEDTAAGMRVFNDVDITGPRARTEKGVDGYGFVFYASLGPLSKDDLEFICTWHTQQRFVTFAEQQPALFDATEAPENVARHVPRQRHGTPVPIQ